MDTEFLTGAGLLVAKMSAFLLLVYASRSATRASREAEAEKTARQKTAALAAEMTRTPDETAPAAEAAPAAPERRRTPEHA